MVEEFDVIDIIGPSPDDRIGLMMFEHRDWSNMEKQLADLQTKVQAYFSYVVDGDMVREYPTYANRPVWFRLVCQVLPPQEVFAKLRLIRDALDKYGIEFQLAHFVVDDESKSINNLIPILGHA